MDGGRVHGALPLPAELKDSGEGEVSFIYISTVEPIMDSWIVSYPGHIDSLG